MMTFIMFLAKLACVLLTILYWAVIVVGGICHTIKCMIKGIIGYVKEVKRREERIGQLNS